MAVEYHSTLAKCHVVLSLLPRLPTAFSLAARLLCSVVKHNQILVGVQVTLAILDAMAQKLVPSLPRIKATIGHIPQRLKAPQFTNPRGRLEVLRQMVTRLVREERFEVKHNKAVECRPYMERVSDKCLTQSVRNLTN